MRLHIVLSTSELIEELEYEAKENQRNSIEYANAKNPKHNNGFGPNGPDAKKVESKVTNAELGKLAGVSKATVTRAKKRTKK